MSTKHVAPSPHSTDLCILATFEERRDADESNVVVPHDCISSFLRRDFEGVLEHCNDSNMSHNPYDQVGAYVPSNAPLPVFSRKDFFSLL